jgi:hypothetical protein
MHTADIAANMGEVIGQAFGEAISGQKSFADAMRNVIPQLLKLFLGEAMAAIIAAGAKQGAKSGNAIVGVVAASAGAAAIGALFSKNTGISAGGSGSARAIPGNFNNAGFTGSNSAQDSNPKLVTVLKGQDIWITLENYRIGNGFTKA